MKEKDILDAVGNVSPELIDKTALPAGRDTPIQRRSGGGKKAEGIRVNRIAAAAVACFLLVGNIALFSFLAKMKTPDVNIPASSTEPDEGAEVTAVPDTTDTTDMIPDMTDEVFYTETTSVPGDVTPTVPDVTGMDFEQARIALTAMGFYADKRLVYNDTVPENMVVSQEPLAGEEVPAGSYIIVFTSMGQNPEGMGVAPGQESGKVTVEVNIPWWANEISYRIDFEENGTVFASYEDADFPITLNGSGIHELKAFLIPTAGDNVTTPTELGTYRVNFDSGTYETIDQKTFFAADPEKGVQIRAKNISSTGCTIVVENYTEKTVVIGKSFRITENDRELEKIEENIAFNAIGRCITPGSTGTFEYPWKWIYGELPSGSYRLYLDGDLAGRYVDFTL